MYIPLPVYRSIISIGDRRLSPGTCCRSLLLLLLFLPWSQFVGVPWLKMVVGPTNLLLGFGIYSCVRTGLKLHRTSVGFKSGADSAWVWGYSTLWKNFTIWTPLNNLWSIHYISPSLSGTRRIVEQYFHPDRVSFVSYLPTTPFVFSSILWNNNLYHVCMIFMTYTLRN